MEWTKYGFVEESNVFLTLEEAQEECNKRNKKEKIKKEVINNER